MWPFFFFFFFFLNYTRDSVWADTQKEITRTKKWWLGQPLSIHIERWKRYPFTWLVAELRAEHMVREHFSAVVGLKSCTIPKCMFKLTYLSWAVCPLTLVSVQEFPLPGSWSERGSEWTGSRLRHRHSGRCRCEGHSSAAKAICGHDPHPDFRWGLGAVRAHRRPHPVYKVIVHDISATRSILCCCWRKKCKMWENLFKKKKIFCHTKVKVREEKNESKWHHNYGLISTVCTVVSVW